MAMNKIDNNIDLKIVNTEAYCVNPFYFYRQVKPAVLYGRRLDGDGIPRRIKYINYGVLPVYLNNIR